MKTTIYFLVTLIAAITGAPNRKHKSAMSSILQANKGIDQTDIIDGDVKVNKQSTLDSRQLKWPYHHMHYTIRLTDFSSSEVDNIRIAINRIRTTTCIGFTEHSHGSVGARDYVEIINGDGCWSYIGRQGGKQQLSVSSTYCSGQGEIIHEVLHALGVDHETARKDGDKYIKVNWENIENGKKGNFERKEAKIVGTVYDEYSVMQYGNDAYSNGKGDTLVWKADPSLQLGGDELTEIDILQLNLYYGCILIPKTTTEKPKIKTTTPKSTTTTMKPTTKSTTTMKTTTTTTKTTEVCGDTKFKCVNAHWNKKNCAAQEYKDSCPQSCLLCGDVGDKLQCGNFKNIYHDCVGRGIQKCIIKNYGMRRDMKENCTKFCCEKGRLYK